MTPGPLSAGRFADLRTRIVWGVVVAALALGCIWAGGLWIALLGALAAGLMMAEWRRITSPEDDEPLRTGGLYVFAAGWVPLIVHVQGWGVGVAGLAVMTLWAMAMDRRGGRGAQALWSGMGAVYIGLAALAFVELRAVDPYGFLSILWAALVVVAADVGGYFAGRTIGGPKLWPAVSPKKTWAGLGGGVALAFVAGGLFSWATTGTYFPQVCAVSAVAAVLAQAGDLGESALKRRFGVKDAGSLIPGHGGLLDRLDGHMAAVLVAAAVTFWRGEAVFVW